MKRRWVSLMLAMAAAANITACSSVSSPAPSSTPALQTEAAAETSKAAESEAAVQTEAAESEEAVERESFVFTDDCGREVEIPGKVTRLVASGPLAQIILFGLAPDELVGLAAKWYDTAEGFIDQKYFDLPYFGQLYGSANLNIEELALAEPQLIVDIGEAKPSIKEDLDMLQEQINIPAVFISATLETMPETYRTMGKMLNKEEKAEELAEFCERVYDRTISIMEEVGDNKVDALYIVGEEGTNVLANGSYHAELIDMLTNNVAVVDNPMSKGTGNTVDMEQIVMWDPEFIIFAPDSVYEKAGDDDTWKQMQAIASGNYIQVPEGPHNWMGSPPAVQRYLGMIWLTDTLYPEYCDYDVKEEIFEYYDLFYDCQLTEEQYEALTENAFLK